MNAGTKLAALNKFRSTASVMMRQPLTKALVVYDVQVKIPEISHVPLIINYGISSFCRFSPLLKTLQIYPKQWKNMLIGRHCHIFISLLSRQRFDSVAPAIASSYARAGVIINFVTATGGDVEMLRSIECFYK